MTDTWQDIAIAFLAAQSKGEDVTIDDILEECELRGVPSDPVRLVVLDQAPALQRGYIKYNDGSKEFAMWRRRPSVYLSLVGHHSAWIAVDTPELREALGLWREVNDADVQQISGKYGKFLY